MNKYITGATIIGLFASLALNYALYTGKLIIPNADYITTVCNGKNC